MDIHGSIIENLGSAIASAKRLRSRPVHADTLEFWRELLLEAQRRRPRLNPAEWPLLDELIAKLEQELSARQG